MLEGDIPVILTLRTDREGGSFPLNGIAHGGEDAPESAVPGVSPDGREMYKKGISILMATARSIGGFHVDVEHEMVMVDEGLGELVSTANPGTLVLSHHDTVSVPPIQSILDGSEVMASVVRPVGGVVKIVYTPGSQDEVDAFIGHLPGILEVLGDTPRIILLMGTHAGPTRLLSHEWGNEWTYAPLPGHPTAPGQLDVLALNDGMRR